MGTAPEAPLPTLSPPLRRLRWLRRATLAAAALIVVHSVGRPLAVVLLLGLPWSEFARPARELLWLPPVVAVYVFVWWRLRAGWNRPGLALGFAVGIVGFVITVFQLLDELSRFPSYWLAYVWMAPLALLTLAQAAMVVSALGAPYALGREEGGAARRVWQTMKPTVFGVVGVVLAGLILSYNFALRPRGFPANESTAAGSLRTINTAAVVYNDTYKNGFPPNLSVLGPPPAASEPSCQAADLIDPTLLTGEKNGYAFVYTPGPPVGDPVAGCPVGVESYTVSARPLRYEKTGVRSFFSDESAVLRWTPEDRAATVNDEPVQ
ncbi:MAG: hypothetical protein HYY26_02200 [Acidobacteria bacterium]|nr:hypothetical protein [Acidobacteriota bacterium]